MSKPSSQARIAKLKADLESALAATRFARALAASTELEKLEPKEARWAQKSGDLLRRMGKPAEAAAAFERAARIWADQGFVARAIAMAKTIMAIDPSRRALLDELDPSVAQHEHRKARPLATGVHEAPLTLAEAAPELALEPDARADEVRFIPAPATARSIMIDLSELLSIEQSAEDAGPELEMAAEPREIDALALLPGFPLFAELRQQALARLAEGAELVELEGGLHVFRRGDPADALYAIVEGAVGVDVPGRPRLGEGDVFGEACLSSNARRSADVITIGKLVALRFPRALLDEIAPAAPALERVLAELLGRRLLANALAASPLFSALPAADRRELGLLFELRRAPPRLPLLSRGKSGDALYVVMSGELALEFETGQTRRAGPGAIVGERSLLALGASDITARSARGALVLRLTATRLAELVGRRPALALHLASLELDTDASDLDVAAMI